jgi:hypothetical protein
VEAALTRGSPGYRIVFFQVLPNAASPVITLVGFNAGILVGGAAVTETVAFHGLGAQLLRAMGRALARRAGSRPGHSGSRPQRVRRRSARERGTRLNHSSRCSRERAPWTWGSRRGLREAAWCGAVVTVSGRRQCGWPGVRLLARVGGERRAPSEAQRSGPPRVRLTLGRRPRRSIGRCRGRCRG